MWTCLMSLNSTKWIVWYGFDGVCRFRLVPFLVELRAVMDWVWTDTTLSLSDWMCVEDIYANIFIIKCSRETEKVWSVWFTTLTDWDSSHGFYKVD